jgi:hypothetical protein
MYILFIKDQLKYHFLIGLELIPVKSSVIVENHGRTFKNPCDSMFNYLKFYPKLYSSLEIIPLSNIFIRSHPVTYSKSSLFKNQLNINNLTAFPNFATNEIVGKSWKRNPRKVNFACVKMSK